MSMLLGKSMLLKPSTVCRTIRTDQITWKVGEHADNGHRMMEPVQKGELLFAQHDEEGVAEFEHFRPGEHPGPEHIGLVRFVGVIAGGRMKAVTVEFGEDLGQKVVAADHAEHAEHGAPQTEWVAQIVGLTVFHVRHAIVDGQHVEHGEREADHPVLRMPLHPVVLIPVFAQAEHRSKLVQTGIARVS